MCEVTTEATFLAAGTGSITPSFDTHGQTVFQIVPFGETPVPGSSGYYVSIADTLTETISSLTPGATVRLRGMMFVHFSRGVMGTSRRDAVASRVFRSVSVVQTSESTISSNVSVAAPVVRTSAPSQGSGSARVAVVTEGEGLDAPSVQLAIRETLSRQEVVLLDRSSVAAARAFVSSSSSLSNEDATRLAISLGVDRLLVISIRAQLEVGQLALQILTIDRGATPSPRFRSIRSDALQDEVVSTLGLIPPIQLARPPQETVLVSNRTSVRPTDVGGNAATNEHSVTSLESDRPQMTAGTRFSLSALVSSPGTGADLRLEFPIASRIGGIDATLLSD